MPLKNAADASRRQACATKMPVARRVASVAMKLSAKVHLHPEMAGELGVAFLQLVEVLHRADQHDLDVHVHRLGLQRDGTHGRAHRARLLDLQTPVAQEAAQLLPDQRVGHQVAQVQHQEAAVRLEQAAGADAREVGHQHIVLGLVFDAAEQRAKQRVVLDDHRRAAQALVVHHQVHAVARQRGLQGLPGGFHRRARTPRTARRFPARRARPRPARRRA
jgi:hypothetical protein